MKPLSLVARDTGPLLGFDLMKQARAIKADLKRLTGDNSAYYSVLARFEVGHFNDISVVAPENGHEPAAMAQRVLTGLQHELNAQTWAASEEGPVDAKGKKKKLKLFLGFQSEEAFEEVREHLRILSGDDTLYANTLRSYGYEKASDIPTHEAGIKVYKELCAERNRIQMERETIAAASKQVGPERAKELMDTLRNAYETLGAGTFFRVLDEHGCPTIDEAVRSYRLGEIMGKLREIAEQRKAIA